MIYLCFDIAACNRTITNRNGRVSSPGFPQYYPAHANCWINISLPGSQNLALFFNAFDIEGHEDCRYDYLEVTLFMMVT